MYFYVIDTNVILRLFINDDEKKHKDSLLLFEHVKSNGLRIVILGIVLSELVWTLKSFYGFPKKKVVEALNSLVSFPGTKVVDDYSYSQAIDSFATSKSKFIDCLIASSSQITSGKAKLISYDRDFDKLGLKRYQPEEIIGKLR